MGRRANLLLPVVFVLFVAGLFYSTFVAAPVPAASEDVPSTPSQAPPAAAAGAGAVLPPAEVGDVEAPPLATAGGYDHQIGVLMMACNRPDVRRALDGLFRCVRVHACVRVSVCVLRRWGGQAPPERQVPHCAEPGGP
jgi:hypothetical protein